MELADITFRRKIQSGINLLFSDWDGFEKWCGGTWSEFESSQNELLKLILWALKQFKN
jgi:hypothetical protein